MISGPYILVSIPKAPFFLVHWFHPIQKYFFSRFSPQKNDSFTKITDIQDHEFEVCIPHNSLSGALMKLDPQGITRPNIFCVSLSHTYGLMRWKLALIVVYKLGLSGAN